MLSQIRGFAFNPARQFAAAKDDSLSDAFKYYIPLLAILGAILSIVAAIGVNMIVSMLGLSGLVLMPGLPELGKIIPLLGVGTFVGTIILGIIAALYIAVWLHGNNCLATGHFLAFHTNDPINFVCQTDFPCIPWLLYPMPGWSRFLLL